MELNEFDRGMFKLIELIKKELSTNQLRETRIDTVKQFLKEKKKEIEAYVNDVATQHRAQKRAELTKEIIKNYVSDDYKNFFRFPIADYELKLKELTLDASIISKDIQKCTSGKPITANNLYVKADFYSLLVGFEGFVHATDLRFFIHNKPIKELPTSDNIDDVLTMLQPLLDRLGQKNEPNEEEERVQITSLASLLEKRMSQIKTESSQETIKALQILSQDFSRQLTSMIGIMKTQHDLILKPENKPSKLKLNKKQTTRNPDKLVRDLFQEIVGSLKLDPGIYNDQIRKVLDASGSHVDFDWHHRAMLASALTLSLLSGWDKEKIILLKEIAEKEGEPLVVERAILGLSIGFLMASDEQLNWALGRCAIFKYNPKFKIILGQCFTFFFREWENYELSDRVKEIEEKLNRKKLFQFFEPPHPRVSYCKVKKSHEAKGLFQRDFFKALNKSVGLDYADKLGVLVEVNSLKEWQENELLLIFANEEKRNLKVLNENPHEYRELEGFRLLEEFFSVIRNKRLTKLNGILDSHIKNLDKGKVRLVFDAFQDSEYLKVLDYKEVIYEFDLTDKDTVRRIGNHLIHHIGDVPAIENAIKYYEMLSQIKGCEALGFSQIGLCFSKIAELTEEINEKLNFLQKAILVYQECLNLDNKNSSVLCEIGACLISMGDFIGEVKDREATYRNAISKYEESLDIEDNPKALCQIAVCLIRIAKLTEGKESQATLWCEALSKYMSSRVFGSEDTLALRGIGDCLIMLAELVEPVDSKTDIYLEAIMNYEEWHKIEKVAAAFDSIAYCLLRMAELTEDDHRKEALYHNAISYYMESQEIEAGTALHFSQIGFCFSRIGDLTQDARNKVRNYQYAVWNYKKFLRFGMANGIVLRHLGYCLEGLGDLTKDIKESVRFYSEAISMYQEAMPLLIDEERFIVIGSMSWVYLKLGDFESAKSYVMQVLDKPLSEVALMNYAHCELVLRNLESAIEKYKSSLDKWKLPQGFFDAFDYDFQFLEPHGISKRQFQKIKKELKNYISSK